MSKVNSVYKYTSTSGGEVTIVDDKNSMGDEVGNEI